jgi:hypothetical protein
MSLEAGAGNSFDEDSVRVRAGADAAKPELASACAKTATIMSEYEVDTHDSTRLRGTSVPSKKASGDRLNQQMCIVSGWSEQAIACQRICRKVMERNSILSGISDKTRITA